MTDHKVTNEITTNEGNERMAVHVALLMVCVAMKQANEANKANEANEANKANEAAREGKTKEDTSDTHTQEERRRSKRKKTQPRVDQDRQAHNDTEADSRPCTPDCPYTLCQNQFQPHTVEIKQMKGPLAAMGSALIAAQDIPPSTWIAPFEGTLHTRAQFERGKCSDEYTFRIDDNTYITAGHAPTGLAHYVANTHGSPNAEFCIIPPKAVALRTTRALKRGQILTVRYGDEYNIEDCVCEYCRSTRVGNV